MIRKIKARIKKFGMVHVTIGLGYKSNSTVYKWLRENKVPNTAKKRVEKYLKEIKI